MIQNLLLLLVPCLVAWLLSVLVFREHPWAWAGWLPATGLGLAGSLVFLVVLAGRYSRRGGGAAEGFAGMALYGFILPGLLIFPLFLGLSWYIRPRLQPSDGALAVGVSTMTGVILAFFYLVDQGGAR